MTNGATPADSAFVASSGGEFVPGAGKNELHVAQDELFVVHAEPKADGMYGTQTIFHIKAARWGREETKLLAFQHNEQRERLAENILLLLAANPGKPVGPVFLHKFTSKTGHEGWELKPTKYEGAKTPIAMPNAAPATPAPQPVAAAQTTDDSLPF